MVNADVPILHSQPALHHRRLPIVTVVGVTSLVRMPVDLFPPINIPVVVVATFFSGHAAGTD